MIVFISAAATERLMVAKAVQDLPSGFPPVRVLSSETLQTGEAVDQLLNEVGSTVKLFVVRVLGGRSYFERGFAAIQDFCQREKRLLMALPGDQNPDAELEAISNVPLSDSLSCLKYALAGGVENYRNLLLYLADVCLSTAFGFEPPAQIPDAGLYHPNAEDRLDCARLSLTEFGERYWQEGRPAIGVLFYRAYWQSGDLAVIDSLIKRSRDAATTLYRCSATACMKKRSNRETQTSLVVTSPETQS